MAYVPYAASPFRRFLPKSSNFFKYILAVPCGDNYWIFIETFFPAFIKAVFLLSFPDIDDLIRGRAEHITEEGLAQKAKRGGKIRRGLGIAKEVPHERYAARGLQFLLFLTQPLETIGYRFLMYHAGEQFFADWQSLLMESGECGRPLGDGPLIWKAGPKQTGILETGEAIAFDDLVVNRAGWVTTGFGATVSNGTFYVVLAVTVTAPTTGLPNAWVRINTTSTIGDQQAQTTGIEIPGGQSRDMVIGAAFKTPFGIGMTITWEIGGSTVPSGVHLQKARVIVQRTEHLNI